MLYVCHGSNLQCDQLGVKLKLLTESVLCVPVHEEIATGSESEGRVEQSTQEEPRRSTRVRKPPERFEEQSC